jgi:hypothetical protein
VVWARHCCTVTSSGLLVRSAAWVAMEMARTRGVSEREREHAQHAKQCIDTMQAGGLAKDSRICPTRSSITRDMDYQYPYAR